ncbi:hypothetical protein HKX48_006971 [Thoreauomyces humboldtii]|nr:hypothetical protein HKX48_006971 [Thoreauomyces humboldtii]
MPRLHVGKLSKQTTDSTLLAHFLNASEAIVAREDKASQRSRGFGFVMFPTLSEGEAAVASLNGSVLDDAIITVKVETPRTPVPPKSKAVPVVKKPDPWTFPVHSSESPLIDIGANLTSKQLKGNISQLLTQSAAANTKTIVITGTSMQCSNDAIKIRAEHHLQPPHNVALYTTAGVHPHEATRLLESHKADWASDLESAITSNRDAVVAVGECGLDYDRQFSAHPDQIVVFEKQLEIAARLKLPVFLHNRDAHEDFVTSLRKFPDISGVVHCHTDSDPEHLEEYLKLGFSIGITGWVCDERRGVELAEIIPRIPLDRLMIETDAPYLMPRNAPGFKKLKNNEPALLGWVLKKVAECYGLPEDVIAKRTTENATRLFGLP